ncbi:mycofactocin system transcriptional regulator [Saccharopolyspora sp. HNM0983]|uniref:Mycofactocin system transcriptional regulator n=2 Tax=Saccharopolyspora montiporae TaxID=2781240 RepID=A0A929BCG4_9PSEU|nr:mycofactocin system transcriptional regulator [Saccharopolyspora sp. HNM0983]MBE9375523.1 mycofactocin system transcriptional regulator [Saccharopolyspora sp. HNM0983]
MARSSSGHTSGATSGRGRRPTTSRHELEEAAFALFEQNGFEATTVEAIARAAGAGRRTFFRYFDSKNDVVWGNFTEQLALMRAQFRACPRDRPLMESLRAVIVEFNRIDPAEAPRHRRRLELILQVPALQAHSTLRYAEWRSVVAEFVAHRLRVAPTALVPQSLSYACLGAALAAYEQWLQNPDVELCDAIDTTMRLLATGFALE